ncbi:TPA: hypothetical protein ACSP3M_004107 [Aeromonas veronii]
MTVTPESFTRQRMGYNDVSYLTKARAAKEIEELNAVKAEIDKRIALLNAVKLVPEITTEERKEAVKAAKESMRKK